MSAKPFDIGHVVKRLEAHAPALRLVGQRGEYSKVRSLASFPTPCAYVLLAVERPVKTSSGASVPGKQNPLAQVVNVGFAVVMAFRNYRGLSNGDELRDELLGVVGEVRDALLGWTPPVNGGRQCQLLAGDLDDFDDAVAVWIDKWETQHIIKPEISA